MRFLVILNFVQADIYAGGVLAPVGNPQITKINLVTGQSKVITLYDVYTTISGAGSAAMGKLFSTFSQTNEYIRFPVLPYWNLEQSIYTVFTIATTPPAPLASKNFNMQVIQVNLITFEWNVLFNLPISTMSYNSYISASGWS